MPFGCGEQNMINFAPNLFILNYLNGTRQLDDKRKKKLTQLLIQGTAKRFSYLI